MNTPPCGIPPPLLSFPCPIYLVSSSSESSCHPRVRGPPMCAAFAPWTSSTPATALSTRAGTRSTVTASSSTLSRARVVMPMIRRVRLEARKYVLFCCTGLFVVCLLMAAQRSAWNRVNVPISSLSLSLSIYLYFFLFLFLSLSLLLFSLICCVSIVFLSDSHPDSSTGKAQEVGQEEQDDGHQLHWVHVPRVLPATSGQFVRFDMYTRLVDITYGMMDD